MSKTLVIALAAAGSLLASAAFAEGTTSKDATGKDSASAASKDSKSATTMKSTKPAKSAETPSSGAASTTMASDVVSMAPIPDTKENRAKYGKPLSHAGQSTAARGN